MTAKPQPLKKLAKPPRRKAKPVRKRGRPCMLEMRGQPFVKEIGRLVTEANSVKAVAESLGLDPDTLYEWIKRGDEHKALNKSSVYRELSEEVKRARACFEIGAMQAITAARDKSWQAAAWQLERTRPEYKQTYELSESANAREVKVTFVDSKPEPVDPKPELVKE